MRETQIRKIPVDQLDQLVTHETKPFASYQAVITGGLTGIGKETATLLTKLGARVHAGTHSIDRFQKGESPLVKPFLFDLAKLEISAIGNSEQPLVQVAQLKSELRLDARPVVLIHSAAAGMEKIFQSRYFLRSLFALKKAANDSARETLMSGLKSYIENAFPDAYEYAQKVNSIGPSLLTQQLADAMPEGSWIIYFSSLWSTYSEEADISVPSFYRPVAQTKHQFETWLLENAQAFGQRGICTAIISGHLVRGTQSGDFLLKIIDLLPEEKRQTIDVKHLPTMQDMATAVAFLLFRNSGITPGRNGVYEVFIFKNGEVTTGLTEKQYQQLASIKLF